MGTQNLRCEASAVEVAGQHDVNLIHRWRHEAGPAMSRDLDLPSFPALSWQTALLTYKDRRLMLGFETSHSAAIESDDSKGRRFRASRRSARCARPVDAMGHGGFVCPERDGLRQKSLRRPTSAPTPYLLATVTAAPL
jgi:hypothetical protein